MVARQAKTQHRTHPAAAALSARRADRGTAAAVLALQRTVGNRAVCRLLDGRAHLLRGRKKGGGAGSAGQQALKAAPNQSEVSFADIPDFAQTAMRNILINGEDGRYLRPARNDKRAGWHGTDPETGMAKADGIGVREYHATPSNESIRIVVRTFGGDKRVYYDSKHTAGTYTYHRVKDPPFPAAPAVEPAAVAPVVPAPAAVPPPAPVPAAAAPVVVPDSWDD